MNRYRVRRHSWQNTSLTRTNPAALVNFLMTKLFRWSQIGPVDNHTPPQLQPFPRKLPASKGRRETAPRGGPLAVPLPWTAPWSQWCCRRSRPVECALQMPGGSIKILRVSVWPHGFAQGPTRSQSTQPRPLWPLF